MNKTAKQVFALLTAALLLVFGAASALAEETHQHTWATVTEQSATCTESGSRVLGCACGETRAESIPALGHAWQEVSEAANCRSGGFTGKRCTRCGLKEGTETSALGHDYGPWVVVSDDCLEGLQQRTCARCGMVHNSEYRGSTHTWGEWTVTVPASADREGEATRICEKCGTWETQAIPRLVFVFGSSETEGLILTVDLTSSAVIGFRSGDVARLNWVITNTTGQQYSLRSIACTQNTYEPEDSGSVDVPLAGDGSSLSGTASVTIASFDSNATQVRIVFQAYFTSPDGSAAYTNQVSITLPLG